MFHSNISEALRHSDKEITANLSAHERLALQTLQQREDIVIRPADKGSAIVIQDGKCYHDEALRQLTDGMFYTKLDGDPTFQYNEKVRKVVKSMEARGVINSKTAADLIETKPRTPHFYTLPKIHKRKDNPPGRPIVSSNRSPTERISAFVDLVLKPLVVNSPSYIRDTKDFLRRLLDLPS